jgi:nitrate reductase NapD
MATHPILTRRELFVPKAATDLDAPVHIASLLVHATPAACQSIKELLRNSPGVEVHDTEHPGKIALVLESADDRAIGATAACVQDIAGVIGVSVVAHVVATERSLQEDYPSG